MAMNRKNITSILQDYTARQAFKIYLQDHKRGDWFLVWEAIREFKGSSCPQIVHQRAQSIFNKYIRENATQEINIDAHTRRKIIQGITDPHSNLFDEAQSYMLMLMEDLFIAFKTSECFIMYKSERLSKPN